MDKNNSRYSAEVILFDFFYGGKSAVEVLSDSTISKVKLKLPEANETTPSFKDIYIKNIVCFYACRAMYFN